MRREVAICRTESGASGIGRPNRGLAVSGRDSSFGSARGGLDMKRTAVIDRRYRGLQIIEAEPQDVESVLPLFLGYLEFYKRPGSSTKARKFLRERLKR